MIEALDGVTAGVSLTTVAQSPDGVRGQCPGRHATTASSTTAPTPSSRCRCPRWATPRAASSRSSAWGRARASTAGELLQAQCHGLSRAVRAAGRLGGGAGPGLVPGQHSAALRRFQAALEGKAGDQLRQDGPLRLLRPERGGQRRDAAVPQHRFRAQRRCSMPAATSAWTPTASRRAFASPTRTPHQERALAPVAGRLRRRARRQLRAVLHLAADHRAGGNPVALVRRRSRQLPALLLAQRPGAGLRRRGAHAQRLGPVGGPAPRRRLDRCSAATASTSSGAARASTAP